MTAGSQGAQSVIIMCTLVQAERKLNGHVLEAHSVTRANWGRQSCYFSSLLL